MAEKSKLGCILPISRVKTIMKSSPEVSVIGQESLFLITKATELFVQDLSLMTLKKSQDAENLQYNDLAKMVEDNETLQFLQDIIPMKVKVKDFYQMTGRKMPGEEKTKKMKKKDTEEDSETKEEEETEEKEELEEDEEEGEEES